MDPRLSRIEFEMLVGLLGELLGEIGGPREKRGALMTGLCRIIGAKAWLWCVFEPDPAKEIPIESILMREGLDDAHIAALWQIQRDPDCRRISQTWLEKLRGLNRTAADVSWYLSDDLAGFVRRTGDPSASVNIGSAFISPHLRRDGRVSAVGFFLPKGEARFSRKDADIAHGLLSGVPWFHEPVVSSAPVSLPTRHRTILNLLLLGTTRKQIAHELGISIHTVSGYVKEIYSFYRVNSQIQLVLHFLEGTKSIRTPAHPGPPTYTESFTAP